MTKQIMIIEKKENPDGSVLWRNHCQICKVWGPWHSDIKIAERNAGIHIRHVHSDRAPS